MYALMDSADQNPIPSPTLTPTVPVTATPSTSVENVPNQSSSGDDYHKKLAESLLKLNDIYDKEFTATLPTKDGAANALFLKEPPLSTPDFLKGDRETQMKAIQEVGLVGFISGTGLIIVKGEAASQLYQFMHADDKKKYGDNLETSVGTINYNYQKPPLSTLTDLIGDKEPNALSEVNLWNSATKTTAEIAEMKRFVLREAKVEEVIRQAYETTAKLAEKAG